MQLVKIDSSTINSLKQRLVKVLRLGKSDVQTPREVAPFGVDAPAPKGWVGLFAETGIKGKPVLIGYINTNQQANPGEVRLYSVDSNGDEKTYFYLKSNGTIEVAGNADNLVRYAPLNQAISNFETFLQTELGKIQTGIATAGGSYTPGTVSIDISDAKINELKTTAPQ